MTHREAFHRLMRFEQTDWVPNYELGAWGQTIARWQTEGMPEHALHQEGTWFEGAPLWDLDPRGFAPLHTGMLPAFEPLVIEETDRLIVARHANGITTRALKEGTVRGTRLCMDQYIAHPVTDRASWLDVKRRYDPTTPIRYPHWWSEWTRMWNTADYPVCLLTNGAFGLYSQLRSWVGTEELSYMFFDEPALIEEMVEFWADFFLALVEQALNEIQFDYFNFFEDLSGKSGPLISPALFRKFLLKPYSRIIDRLRRVGIQSFWVDSDGNPEALIPLWLEAGVNCLWPLEQASGMDPLRLRREYGRDLVLAGGLDKLEVAKGPEAIERELTAKIPPLLESGGYLPHLDHAFSPEISYDCFMTYLEIKNRLMGR